MPQAQALTPKQENFCLVYMETGNASEAYRQSYNAENTKPAVINVKASELLKHGKISVRIADLKQAIAKKTAITVDSLSNDLEEDRQLAHKEGQAGAAVSATMGKAKLHGLVDRQDPRQGAGIEIYGTREERDFMLAKLLGTPNEPKTIDITPDSPDLDKLPKS